jgi:hypothetical protein
MDINECIVYDVEVIKGPDEVEGGWDNPAGMGFASAVAYSYQKDQYYMFLGPDGKEDLITLLYESITITFNGIKFDSRILLGNDRNIANTGKTSSKRTLSKWDNFDILLEYLKARFGHNTVQEAEEALGDKLIHDGSFGLDGLAEGTLSLHKTGHGADAPNLYKTGQFGELLAYNLQAVRLTKKLFDFIREYGFLVDRAGKIVHLYPVLVPD